MWCLVFFSIVCLLVILVSVEVSLLYVCLVIDVISRNLCSLGFRVFSMFLFRNLWIMLLVLESLCRSWVVLFLLCSDSVVSCSVVVYLLVEVVSVCMFVCGNCRLLVLFSSVVVLLVLKCKVVELILVSLLLICNLFIGKLV